MKKYLTLYVDSECGGGPEEIRLWNSKEEALTHLHESGGERWYLTGLEIYELSCDTNTVEDLKGIRK